MSKAFHRNSAAEESSIAGGIALDQDNPEWTAEDFAQARPASEMIPGLVTALRKNRGPQKAPTKQQVALRLDRDLVEALRATGAGWQGRVNEMLRRALLGHEAR